MSRFQDEVAQLRLRPRTWLVTGIAGFIGSNLAEALLREGQHVVGLDNFATGFRHNLDDVREAAGEQAWARLEFVEGDIRDLDTCRGVCERVDFVLHQAALGSVPRSIDDPLATNAANVDGFLNMLVAARDARVRRFVYAASSSTYGDHPGLPKVENRIGRPLSPYAVTKYVDELYASVFQRTYGMQVLGLRYFNVFGKRQDPNGAYAAVIPRWLGNLVEGESCIINGDGETTRDFCYVANVVQANILAATAPDEATDRVYNVAFGARTSLNNLYFALRDGLVPALPQIAGVAPAYGDFRTGDVRHSLADISLARRCLGYEPTHDLRRGLAEALPWYLEHLAAPLAV